jgi:thiol:disulfide interchange protein DsbC
MNRKPKMNKLLAPLCAALLAALALGCSSVPPEDTIRQALSERLPNLPKIDEVTKTPMDGLYEVRVNQTEIFYTDRAGNFLIQGELIDTKGRQNLTEARIEKLTSVAFDSLPIKDAFTIVRGNGERKMAIFEDPNCGFCKRYERELEKLDNVTMHVFLYPILGPDSIVKSGHIWCAPDKGKTFVGWMVNGELPPAASCDTAAVQRNVAFGQKNRITGTPTTFFADGSRVAGAVPLERVEQGLNAKP